MPIAKPSLAAPDRPELPDALPYRTDGRLVVLTEPVPLGAGGRAAAEAVRLLRECQSHVLPVRWSLAPDDPVLREPAAADFALHHLHHLPPPADAAGGPGDAAPTGPAPSRALADWRATYGYGRFYYRQGPGFLQVRDRRDPDASARFALDHPDLVATFRTCLTPTALDDLSGTGREAVSVLASEGLVLVTRGWAVTLPPRIRHWTVPDTGV
ncbi:DUF5825 family protein [Kitasatospora sp. NPDC092039]|uniref:DUF5825 family protein n=1 Tax=Kitasatospora sp. NPDC092039 TaxID=3364086 RepID=UPI00380A8DB0